MAADYAAVLEQEIGPSHLMGFSTGGEIAQYVAIDHPASVRSLILVVSACRLSEAGREICERWQALATRGRWRELRADMASVAVSGETNKRLARAFMRVFGRLVFRVPSDPQDFLTTLEADLGPRYYRKVGRDLRAVPHHRRKRRSLLLGGPPARDRRKDTRRDPAPLRGRRSRSTEGAQASLRGGRACVPGRPSWKIVR